MGRDRPAQRLRAHRETLQEGRLLPSSSSTRLNSPSGPSRYTEPFRLRSTSFGFAFICSMISLLKGASFKGVIIVFGSNKINKYKYYILVLSRHLHFCNRDRYQWKSTVLGTKAKHKNMLFLLMKSNENKRYKNLCHYLCLFKIVF